MPIAVVSSFMFEFPVSDFEVSRPRVETTLEDADGEVVVGMSTDDVVVLA